MHKTLAKTRARKDTQHMSTDTAVCARCRFGAATPQSGAPVAAAWLAAPTYAFALALGPDVPAAAAAAEAWAAGHAETSATAFCCACGQVCWLARRADAQAALLAHAALLRGVRALRRQAGVAPAAATQLGDVHPELPAPAAEADAEAAEAEAGTAEAAGAWGSDAPAAPKPKRSRKRRAPPPPPPPPPPAAQDVPLFDFDWAS